MGKYWIVGLIAVVFVLLAWGFRLEITSSSQGAYLLDRWTGQVYWLGQDEKYPLITVKQK